MKTALSTLYFCFLAAGILVMTGCGSGTALPAGGDELVEGDGTMRLLITDRPYPVNLIERADVTIVRIDVLPEGASDFDDVDDDTTDDASQVTPDDDPESEDSDAEDGEDTEDTDSISNANFLTVYEGEQTFNLLDLQNGESDVLTNAEIPAGTYTQMRFVITGGVVELTDGREIDLEVPSGEQSGIKLHFTFEVVADQETELLLDFDLSRAFQPVPAGHADDPSTIETFHFRPSLGMRLVNMATCGSVSGTVSALDGTPLGDVLVTAYLNGTEVTSTVSADDGTYRLIGLESGAYRFEISANGYTDSELTSVGVVEGQSTSNMNATMTPE